MKPKDQNHSEKHHWYTAEGKPCHEVPYRDPDKGMRPTTLRDARKLKLFPSVTTVIKPITYGKLKDWWGKQIAMSALTLPEIEGESADDRYQRILTDAGEHVREAAKEGTRIHAALEQALRREPYDDAYKPHVRPVLLALKALREEISQNLPHTLRWEAETPLEPSMVGYGGRADLLLVDEDWIPNGTCWAVVDFKTKDFTPEDALKKGSRGLVYDEWAYQLAGYAHGFGCHPSARWFSFVISRSNPGCFFQHEWTDKKRFLECFLDLLSFWKNARDFYPERL